MNTIAKLSALAAVALLSGCASSKIDLPDITAGKVYISHQNPLFNAKLSADNVKDHGHYVTADRIEYDRGGRFTSTVIILEDYRREKKPEDAPVPLPVAAPAQQATPPPSSNEPSS